MKTDIIDKIDSEKKVIQIKENRFETIHDGKSIMHSFSNSSLLRFVIKILKYPFKKCGSFYRGILKNIGRLLYKKAPFSNINLMIDTRFNKPQYEYVEYNKWYQHGLAIKTYAGFGNKYRLPVGLEHGTH
ncbi:MAG: hypothetical protein LBE13_01920, partial [Bacteroidales bacterium]|nr:hypothetical protein [Bacteroidales bacterium]